MSLTTFTLLSHVRADATPHTQACVSAHTHTSQRSAGMFEGGSNLP